MQFERPVDAATFASLPGVTHTQVNGLEVELQVSGDIRPALETGLAHGLVDLTARHADLDELFLSYYRQPDPDGAGS